MPMLGFNTLALSFLMSFFRPSPVTTPEATLPFELRITFKNNKVELDNQQGCTFSLLVFKANRQVVLNQSGMVNLEAEPKAVDDSRFLFRYTKQGKTIYLTGIKGMAWKTLTFQEDGKPHVLDQNGLK
ncbi:hypothetical protein LRS06_20485 [Hymenobacter sp. J193]|uniref:hypothetical protein n=1 Tax=Hymenobacter sp. J193 TaxID=2898429 RepID=UPI00215114B6|nr:hypothetical protein [Hymenobacter sp. J193]MCR5890107.1 hypothetical protein [Hymenobacter sp. J193]